MLGASRDKFRVRSKSENLIIWRHSCCRRSKPCMLIYGILT